MKPLRVAVAGAGGRMGRAIVRLLLGNPQMQLASAFTAGDDPLIGRDAGELAGVGPCGVLLTNDDRAAECDVLIEFSSAAGTRQWAGWCERHGVALVSGTTGLTDADQAALRSAAKRSPVLWAPNMSLGVSVLRELARRAAELLGPDWQIEIVETHHDRKADAPSGTARALLESVVEGRGAPAPPVIRHGREGLIGARSAEEIGMHALRIGGVIGDHSVHFGSSSEVVTLEHRALTRDVFAAGALRAARWLAGRPAGLYAMRDVLARPT